MARSRNARALDLRTSLTDAHGERVIDGRVLLRLCVESISIELMQGVEYQEYSVFPARQLRRRLTLSANANTRTRAPVRMRKDKAITRINRKGRCSS
jgi:hypothetical protein